MTSRTPPGASDPELARLPFTALLGQVQRLVTEGLRRGLADTTVRPIDVAVFSLLAWRDLRLTTLGRYMGMTKQALTFVIDRLENDGYVTRVADPDDHRAKLIRLTPKGLEAAEVAWRAVAALEKRWADEVGRDDWEHARRVMVSIVQAESRRRS